MSKGNEMTREAIKNERRRRNSDGLAGIRNRLGHSEEMDKDYVYRWVNDEGTRVHQLTVNDDWDFVVSRDGSAKADATGLGANVSVPVGTDKNGAPVKGVLLRKRKDYHDEDEQAKRRRIDELENGLKAGATPGADRDRQYVPSGGIHIESGGKA